MKSLKEIVCFGVREFESPTFEEINKKYQFNLTYYGDFLTKDNLELAAGYQAVIVRGNCFLDEDCLKKLASKGLKYLLTRSTGYDHLDLEACKKLRIKVANVPAYSPNAISELVVSLTLMLVRRTAYIVNQTSQKNFLNDELMCAKEIRNCVIGVIGCGKIGLTTAKLFNGLGAKVLGYDPNLSDEYPFLELTTLPTLLKKSDVITLHLPYLPGINDNFIDEDKFSQMKDGVVIINTARGEVLNLVTLLKYLENGKISGAALDVIPCENEIFFKKHSEEVPSPVVEALLKLYPRVLITPHIGFCTFQALENMVEITLQNYQDYLDTNKCKNSIVD